MLIALVAAAVLTVADPVLPAPTPTPAHRRKRRSPAKAVRKLSPARQEDFIILAWRHGLLHDFLVEARSERPAFEDDRISSVRPGISIGPTSADVDFLGSPIVRARVHNASGRTEDLLLTAVIRDGAGKLVEASVPVEGLRAGESRAVELFCPAPLLPAAVEWKASAI